MIEVKAMHPKHLRTIPMNMRDQFLRLAFDDVLLSLYPLRHRFDQFTTVYGAIQIFMDQVDGAAADKQELLETWRTNLLTDSKAKKIWIS